MPGATPTARPVRAGGLRKGDWLRGSGAVRPLLCNPPYVEIGADLPRDVAEWEPAEALFAAADGLSEYRRLASEIPRLLARPVSPALSWGPASGTPRRRSSMGPD